MQEKVRMEQELLGAFGEMSAAAAGMSLPVFETILAEEMIPRFQRTVLRTIPDLAQQTAGEVATRHGSRRRESQQSLSNPNSRSAQTAVLWRTHVVPVGYPDEEDPRLRTLPVFDAGPTGSDYSQLSNARQYFSFATLQRRELAKHYLERWIRDKLRLFATDAGLFYGGGVGLLCDQFVGGVAIAVFVSVATGALCFGLKAAGILRVSAEEELVGLDISEHGAPGYGPDILTGGVPSSLSSASVGAGSIKV